MLNGGIDVAPPDVEGLMLTLPETEQAPPWADPGRIFFLGGKRQNFSFLTMHCHRRNVKNKAFWRGPWPPLDPPVSPTHHAVSDGMPSQFA